LAHWLNFKAKYITSHYLIPVSTSPDQPLPRSPPTSSLSCTYHALSIWYGSWVAVRPTEHTLGLRDP